MKTSIYLSILVLAIFGASCSGESSKSSGSGSEKDTYHPVEINPDRIAIVTLNDSIKHIVMRRGKKAVHETGLALKKELKQSISVNGLEGSIDFCSSRAMIITDSISIAKQVVVRRLAKKNRHPANETIDRESDIYKNYVMNWIGGNKLQPMVGSNQQGQPVYYHPIKVDKLCLNCHGSVEENIPPAVAKRIAQLYPDDKAVNFKEGELRGMWAVTFPEYRINDVDLSQQNQ